MLINETGESRKKCRLRNGLYLIKMLMCAVDDYEQLVEAQNFVY